ncbi:hypothetical protein BMS3Abin07_01554 [bacterium BMS3Abin07]|nr:hypothetical protein BMS3Abin07_01554 [bacterium BMS3Abin07]GBE32130.1 hypothetical protein BMS3Bbin05_01039 [bacterium BMS3Bbin05]HDL20607.1 DUF2845 domain-containing protein [Nitrospirota bacterium]HDO22213.1 DUF2845 domain-containing protein [Nitrospirota bacterium]
MRKISIYFVFVILYLLTINDNALSFYCSNKLVSIGDTVAEVTMKCGKPFWKEQHKEKVVTDGNTDKKYIVTIIVDEWTYNFGPQDWLYLLRFENGKLVKIETLGYGY